MKNSCCHRFVDARAINFNDRLAASFAEPTEEQSADKRRATEWLKLSQAQKGERRKQSIIDGTLKLDDYSFNNLLRFDPNPDDTYNTSLIRSHPQIKKMRRH